MKIISSILLVTLSSGASAQPRPNKHKAKQEEAEGAVRGLANEAVIDVKNLYENLGEDVIEGFAKPYQELIIDVEDELLAAFPYLDPEGLALAKEALMDLLEELPNSPELADTGLTQRAQAYRGGYGSYGSYESYGGGGKHGGYGGYGGGG